MTNPRKVLVLVALALALAPLSQAVADGCGGILVYNHDNGFENALAWSYENVQPPYYGAFGEGFDLPEETSILCLALWLTDLGFYDGQTCDLYVWEGGVSVEPGAVIAMAGGVDPGAPAHWPDVSRHDFNIPDLVVGPGEITVGFWGDWVGEEWGWYCAEDVDNPIPGSPWTCVAPGSGWGTGWVRPWDIWGWDASLGLGFYREDPTPVESSTWGAIRALYR